MDEATRKQIALDILHLQVDPESTTLAVVTTQHLDRQDAVHTKLQYAPSIGDYMDFLSSRLVIE